MTHRTIYFFALVCCFAPNNAPADQLFENQIAPIFQRRCLSCHNERQREGGFSLQSGASALADGYIEPGAPEASHLLELITPADGKAEMPKDADPLSAAQVRLVRDWIRAGAIWPEDLQLNEAQVTNLDWWSLRSLNQPEVPNVAGVWARNEIDQFVFRKLQEKGLSPSPPADPRTLIRRLTFDLTGLPPTPEEVRAFVLHSKENPNRAYVKLVDRLLNSPRYGEHWARHWLDVARYGESHGYDKDKARFHAWPYRDYVIRSFNNDKPWTRFVQEQVAGDVLFPNDPDGVIAMGFVAAGPWDHIAHVEVGEGKLDGRMAKHLDRDDMVSAVFNGFMSTTVQCAQCHNHKFDPVSTTDYYRLHTIFAAVDRRDRVYDLDPEILRKRSRIQREMADLDRKLRDIEAAIDAEGGAELKEFRRRMTELQKTAKAKLNFVPEHGYHSLIERKPNAEKWVQLELAEPTEIATIRLIGSYDNFANVGAGFGFPVRFKVEIADDAKFENNPKIVGDFTKRDFLNPGLTPVTIDGGFGKFVRVTATKLAHHNQYMFALAEVELLNAEGNNLATGAKVTAKDSIESGDRWGRDHLVDGKFSSDGDFQVAAELTNLQAKVKKILAKVETPERLKQRASFRNRRDQLRKQLSALPQGKLVYTLATEFQPSGKVIPTLGKPRTIRLLHRGDLRSPGEEMMPGAPALWETAASTFDLGAEHTEGDRRAALARYLTHPDNPLLWRSAANRIWLGHFGRGIVDSPNDFGRMGMQPTHPELLDWLAVRLRDTDSVKELHRLIVTSATYRQSSMEQLAQSAVDASNLYYWRATRRKLRAEEVRDSILEVAGVLDLSMGGPSFQDFEFQDDHTPKYHYHLHDANDPKTHRRTIYRFIARSQTHPFLTTLDCADPSQMVPKRDETTTALQALALLNNPFITAMSERFSVRVEDMDHAVWLALGRAATAVEKDILENYTRQHGMAATARLLFNLNEFVYVD